MSDKEPLDFSKLSVRDFPYKKKLSFEQEDLVVKLFKKQRVLVDSVAGSGKTTVITQAMKALMDHGYINKIYYVISPVQERELGYLPGGVSEKIKEYAVPFIQALRTAGVNTANLDLTLLCDEFTDTDYNIIPHVYLRGRTIEKAGVFIDEAQNYTQEELKKVFTRLSDSCYVAIAGHNGQQDIPNSGFPNYINYFKRGVETGIYTDIAFAELTENFRGEFSRFCDQIEN